jgi:hypothetical protein
MRTLAPVVRRLRAAGAAFACQTRFSHRAGKDGHHGIEHQTPMQHRVRRPGNH